MKSLLLGIVAMSVAISFADDCHFYPEPSGSWSNAGLWERPLADGDTLVLSVTNGFNGGALSMGNKTTPRLAGFRLERSDVGGTGLSLRDATCLFDTTQKVPFSIYGSGRIVFYDTFKVNPNEDLWLDYSGGIVQLEGIQTCNMKLDLNGGQFLVMKDGVLGLDPVEFCSDAIVIGNCALSTDRYRTDAEDVHIHPNRGITIADGKCAYFLAHNDLNLVLGSVISGNGDLAVVRRSGKVHLAAQNIYTGKTLLGSGAAAPDGTASSLYMDVDNALPATTTIGTYPGSDARLYLCGTSQRVAKIDGGNKINIVGPGTLRFGTEDDALVTSCTNLAIKESARLVYCGNGTVRPTIPSFTSTGVIVMESGTLSLEANTPLYGAMVELYDGARVVLGENVTQFTSPLILKGTVTFVVPNGSLLFTKDITQAADATSPAKIVFESATAVTFGKNDQTLRRLDATFENASSVTLDGYVASNGSLENCTKGAGCVIFGAAAGLRGDQVLTGGTIGLLSGSDLGTGGESIVAKDGSRVLFYATDATDMSYDVTLDASSSMTVLGGGSVTFTGSVHGPGTVAFNDTQLVVPEGRTVELGATSGSVTKYGAGTLKLTARGTAALTVAEGTVRLASSDGAAVASVVIQEGSTLALDADEQISDDNDLVIYGTFDLNGHVESVYSYSNHTSDDGNGARIRDVAAIVNTSSNPAKLSSIRNDVHFFGSVTENPGSIELEHGGNIPSMMLFGQEGAIAPSKITMSGGSLFPYTIGYVYLFKFRRAWGSTDTNPLPVAISEIQLTCKGVPIPKEYYDISKGEVSSGAVGSITDVLDGDPMTYWMPQESDGTNAYVKIVVSTYAKVDGYRICGAPEYANNPMDWDVFAFRYQADGNVLVDEKRNVKLTSMSDGNNDDKYYKQNLSTNFLFSATTCKRNPFADNTEIALTKPNVWQLRAANVEPLRFGTLSGVGDVRLDEGSDLAVGNMNGWSGSIVQVKCDSMDSMSRIWLDSTRCSEPQRVPVVNVGNANVSIENATENPASILLDDAFPDRALLGRLADGNGPLGIVKRGTSTRRLETQNSANTGTVNIEAGRLVVDAKRPYEVTARYIRITPIMNNSGSTQTQYYWGMNEFELLDMAGNKVAWPSTPSVASGLVGDSAATLTGATSLVDGNTKTRMIAHDGTGGVKNPVVIDAKSPVTFAGYRWYAPAKIGTSDGSYSSDRKRVLVEWTIDISSDKTNWTTIHNGTQTADHIPATIPDDGVRCGPFNNGLSTGSDSLYTLPAKFLAEGGAWDAAAPALKSRYFKFVPFQTKRQGTEGNWGWEISEFSLYRNGERIPWTDKAKATMPSELLYTGAGDPMGVINNTWINSKGSDRVYPCKWPAELVIDAGEVTEFDAYAYHTSVYQSARSPTGWNLYLSDNGSDWTLADTRTDVVAPPTSVTEIERVSVANLYPYLSASKAVNRIGDSAPVAIAANAEFEINADYEKTGALSGEGAVILDCAVYALNPLADANASFSGSITGVGTLVIDGEGVQTFDGANLGGVTNLVLKSGILAGNATFGGHDVTITFAGGALAAELTGINKLTVNGTANFAVPADATRAYSAHALTWQTLSEGSRDALQGATFVNMSETLKIRNVRVAIGDTSCTVYYQIPGTVIMVK